MAAGSLRLGALLEDRSLGLQLLTSEDGTGRPVDGAHAIELIDAGRYVEPNWIVLTTGLAFHRRHANGYGQRGCQASRPPTRQALGWSRLI